MDKVLITIIVVLVVLFLITLSAKARIKALYKKYLTIGNSANLTGKALAEISVEKLNLPNLSLATTQNMFADGYVARTKTLILSNAVCNYSSLTSLAVTAHELGHAIQDRQNNRLFGLVQILSRITRFTNKLIIPAFIAGITLYLLGYFNIVAQNLFSLGLTLTYVSFMLLLFHIVVKLTTIPIEYDASKKAINYLKDYNFLTKQEIKHAKKLLNAAAQTYISSLFDRVISITNRLFNTKRKNNK